MKTVTIYGASDDLIEVDGDFEDEFGAYDEPQDLLFSNGCKVRVTYDDDGCWRTELLTPGLCTVVEHKLAEGDHTDRITIEGDFEWMECWPVDGPGRADIIIAIQDSADWDRPTQADLLVMWRILKGHETDNLPK